MTCTYTYDTQKLTEFGRDTMRMDLGDIEVDGGAETYGAGKSWKVAQYRCLQAIVSRMAMMVDVNIDGMKLDMESRYQRWLIMLRCKEKLLMGLSSPLTSRSRTGYAITKGIHDNPRAMGDMIC